MSLDPMCYCIVFEFFIAYKQMMAAKNHWTIMVAGILLMRRRKDCKSQKGQEHNKGNHRLKTILSSEDPTGSMLDSQGASMGQT